MLSQMLSYEFIQRAFVGGVLVSLCAALLGVSLVLKRYSMIGDGLSHVSFGALSIAIACGFAPIKFAIPVVIVAAFLLLRLAENGRMRSDAAIAMVSASALAIGVIVTSVTTGLSTDVYSYMFGSILAMSKEDVTVSVCLSIVVIIMFVFFYHKIFAVTFDESFSKATGVKVGTYNTLISVFTAVTVVIGIKMMGAMLISSLIIFPALTSMRILKSFLSVTVCSAVLAVINFTIGLVCSYIFSIPAGASIVVVNLAVFILFSIFSMVQKRV
ncbi:metal ABC transporter permease [uncultured Eubacterium sp.]|mgnify:FL=1|uniref:metal ABC transporter permease n=1 Tax=uncultured Eubacterium sp. TaxID=165185 RepID=UPI002672A399|nr:metal ABC transporter permease [uncultured Eubacterium sp.]